MFLILFCTKKCAFFSLVKIACLTCFVYVIWGIPGENETKSKYEHPVIYTQHYITSLHQPNREHYSFQVLNFLCWSKSENYRNLQRHKTYKHRNQTQSVSHSFFPIPCDML